MKLGGCRVTIKCNSVVMREIDTTLTEDGKNASCYIASEPGKEFSIEYSRNLNHGPPSTELVVDVYFGGIIDGPGRMPRDPAPWAKKVTGKIYGSRRGGKFYKYVFSKPELIDGETPSSMDPDLIGAIRVRLAFMTGCERVEEAPRSSVSGLGPVKVNEKDKMPGVHCAGLGLEGFSEECTGAYFCGDESEGETINFVFKCRAEGWLQAEGLIRKRRRRSGELEPEGDLGVEPLPKPEPAEEEIHANEFPTSGVRAIPTAGSPNHPHSPTPPNYAGEEPRIRPGEKAPRTPQQTWQEELQPPPSDSVTPERPRKIPRRSGNFAFTIDGEAQPVTIAAYSVHRPSAEGGSGSGMKTEDGGLTNVKLEEVNSAKGLKEEVREGKFDKLKELEAAKKELEAQISKLKEEIDGVQGGKASFPTPRIGSEIDSPQPKIKVERESTGLPSTPEIIDLT